MIGGRGRGRLTDSALEFSRHARARLGQRLITEAEVRSVADTGEVIETYPDDTPHPSELIFGLADSRPLHIVLGYDALENEYIVITAYEPDSERWLPNLRERRR